MKTDKYVHLHVLLQSHVLGLELKTASISSGEDVIIARTLHF